MDGWTYERMDGWITDYVIKTSKCPNKTFNLEYALRDIQES